MLIACNNRLCWSPLCSSEMHLFYLVNITDALSTVSHRGPACKEQNIGLIFVKGSTPMCWSTAIETPFPGFLLCCGSQRRGINCKEGALTEASWQLPSGLPLIWLSREMGEVTRTNFLFCLFFLRVFLMWAIFKIFIEFVTILLLFYVCVFFWPQSM